MIIMTPKQPMRWTSADLELLPDDGKRYEIIDGELYVAKQPHWHHQKVCGRAFLLLELWNEQAGAGEVNLAPGVIFDNDDDVAPDVVGISNARLQTALASDGKLHTAPDLAIEVLSVTGNNERRDREAKLKLYSRKDVLEYWIINWMTKEIEIYRREEDALQLAVILGSQNILETPLLPGFSCAVADFFKGVA